MSEQSRRQFGKLIGGAGAVAAIGVPTFAIAQTKPRVVVIGGGAGGATAAHYLKKDGGAAIDVTLIEANVTYSSSFFSNLFIGGLRRFETLNHGYAGLKSAGVNVVHAYASAIDTTRRVVITRDGKRFPYDKLVLSPGIEVKYESVPGYSKEISNVFPHAYETNGTGKLQLMSAIERLQPGDTFAMVMPNNPYRCPPGPYERACMIAHVLKTKKPKSKLVIIDPKKAFSKQPVFVEAFDKYYKGIVELKLSNDIDDFAVTRFDAKTKTIATKAGETVRFDAANVIPQQRAGYIARAAAVVDGDWVPVNPENFTAKANKDIYVLGDAAVASEMPKSAFSANSQAKVAVNDILAELLRKDKFPARFRNTCWSLLAPEDCVKVGANYTPKDGKLDPSGGFVSQPKEEAGIRKQNYAESVGWYDGIIADMFNKPAAAAAPAKKG